MPGLNPGQLLGNQTPNYDLVIPNSDNSLCNDSIFFSTGSTVSSAFNIGLILIALASAWPNMTLLRTNESGRHQGHLSNTQGPQ